MCCDSVVNENEMFQGEIEDMLNAGVLDEEVNVDFVNIYGYVNNNNNNNNNEMYKQDSKL